MDVAGSRRSSRDTSPDRVKSCRLHHNNNVKVPLKKVQVVYYLSRSGLLEHPHYLELTLPANEPLRLKDVLDRLVAMRGSGMPTLYSWSCKRSYKRGYVWYDLAANDIIYPSEGAEYVLKGSEIVEDCSERVQQARVSKRTQVIYQDPGFNTSRKSFHSSIHREAEDFQAEYEEHEEEYYEDGEKTSNTSSTTTPHSRCSRGVSTGELEEDHHETKPHSQTKTVKVTSVSHAPPQPSAAPTEKLPQIVQIREGKDNSSKRFEEGLEPESRSSILLQLIACGSSAVSKAAKNAPCMNNGVKKKESSSEIRVEREGVKVSSTEEEMMIKCMSENPRLLGNLQLAEKEYFSGSLVESRKLENQVHSEAMFKKSNSYNEERSGKAGIGEEEEGKGEEKEKKEKGGSRGKCIPLSSKKCSRK
ncbi:hypothetical protein QN277_026008 [Acacia crassicarpa]|uniref:SOSEKI DIX-like domain-containing protein n=1 Tax=Acacia crassicarpa TaxID=499986 RepID=A0AAE1J9V5_9FABA|nr:hypothetical protein QN277_026008 [Acacia crassicarpa]